MGRVQPVPAGGMCAGLLEGIGSQRGVCVYVLVGSSSGTYLSSTKRGLFEGETHEAPQSGRQRY